MQLFHAGQPGGIGGDRLNLFGRIVEARHHRHADDELPSRPGQPAGVLQDQPVIPAGKALVLGAVHVLDIHQHQIQPGQRGLQMLPGYGRGGLYRRMDPLLLPRLQQRPGKLRLSKGLPAGERQPTPGTPVVGPVLQDNVHDRSHRNILAHGFYPSGHAHGFNRVILPLRVAAPAAAQQAALQKHDGPDTRPVVNGKLLYVKYPALDKAHILLHACGRL